MFFQLSALGMAFPVAWHIVWFANIALKSLSRDSFDVMFLCVLLIILHSLTIPSKGESKSTIPLMHRLVLHR